MIITNGGTTKNYELDQSKFTQHEFDELLQLCERQRIVIEFLLVAIEAAINGDIEGLQQAYKRAQSQSTQTGSSEK